MTLRSYGEVNRLTFFGSRIGFTDPCKNRTLTSGVNMGQLPIPKLLWILVVLLSAVMPTTGRAQVAINMSRVTCADYLAMTPEQSDVFGAWVGGYFNQKTGYTWIDLDAQSRNEVSLKAWCAQNPGEFVMTGLARAARTPSFQGDPARAVVKVEMSEITCRQFIDSSFDKQVAIGAWMSGYWNAQRNMETLDVSRFRANSKRVSDYCKKRRRETLMATIQRVARY
jgi:HdeA/HdeB family